MVRGNLSIVIGGIGVVLASLLWGADFKAEPPTTRNSTTTPTPAAPVKDSPPTTAPVLIRAPFQSRAKVAATKMQIMAIKAALEMFEIDSGRYPTTNEGLAALVTRPAGADNWHKYLDKMPVDGFGHAFIYRCPGTNGKDFDLISVGPDGVEGGGDDITN